MKKFSAAIECLQAFRNDTGTHELDGAIAFLKVAQVTPKKETIEGLEDAIENYDYMMSEEAFALLAAPPDEED